MKEQTNEALESASEERRAGASQEVIQHLLKERNQLLSLLLQVSSESSQDKIGELESDIEDFIQVLVDYIAAGHFGLYERIAEGKERRKAVSDFALEIYPRIEQTTQIALAFDEKYNSENENRQFDQFAQDISMLGEELTTHIELEDKLIPLLLEQKN
jgi:regulator of sigma D